MSPAEERAEQENLTVVAAVPHDLLSVLSGHPVIMLTADYQPVLVRLATAEELVASVEHFQAEKPGDYPPPPTLADAARLVAPLPL